MLIRGSQHMALRSQIVRASVSIPANIVEGRAKPSDKDFSRFLGYAIGSAAELEYHLGLGRDLGLVSEPNAAELLSQLTEVRKMLHALRRKLDGPDNAPDSA
jgi:four helix bundle protein